MIFTSLTFIIFFCILILFILINENTTYRLYLLLIFSYIFYGWWNVKYLILIFFVSLTGWIFGYLIDAEKERKKRRIYLIINLIICLGLLSYFKYANFFIKITNDILNRDTYYLDIILPVGISFFTFQVLSYTIDIYRKKIQPCHSFVKFSLFVSFFPQLVAGPIVRASEFLPQLNQDIKLKSDNFLVGTQLFLGGAFQKVFIADNLSQFVDVVYKAPEIYAKLTLWLAVFSYSMQIFCDFAGYSLMAIGISRILGFTLPKNFDMPYNSKSITEFWRRWHISLSFWLRDYLYISMGGNRKGVFRTQVNMFITMLLGGLWHGASWNFVIWGALHGIALGCNRLWHLTGRDGVKKLLGNYAYSLLSWSITFLFVSLLWIPFRLPSFEGTLDFCVRLFTATDGVFWYHPQTLLVLSIATIWHLTSQFKLKLLLDFPANVQKINSYSSIFILVSILYILLLFSPMDASPFIYFQF